MSLPELAVFLALLFTFCCHFVVSAHQCKTRFASARLWLKNLRSSNKQSEDKFARSVRREVLRCLSRRVQNLSDMAGVAFMFVVLAEVIMKEIIGTDLQHLTVAVFALGLLLMRLCSERMLERVLPWFYLFIMLCLSCYVLFAEHSGLYAPLRAAAIVGMVRFSFSLVFCQVGTAIVANIAVTLASSYTMMSIDDWPPHEFGGAYSFIATECVLTVFVIMLTWEARKALERECSHLVENRSLSVESSAMTTLMGFVCDVVVELDESLRIAKDVPNLAAILGTTRDVQGLSFSELIRDDFDRERFKQRLIDTSESQAGNCRQGAMIIALSGSMDSSIPVELFFTMFDNPSSSGDGSTCFVGIRELADQPVAKLPRSKLDGFADAQLEGARSALEKPPVCGTPAVRTKRALSKDDAPDETASVSSNGSRHSASAWVAIDDRFQHTTTDAKRLSVLEILMQWNFVIPGRSCCPYHAALIELRSQTKAMARGPCNKTFRLAGDYQCEGCGIVMDCEDDEDFAHCDGYGIRHAQSRSNSALWIARPPLIAL